MSGAGEMAARIRDHDWSTTSLGTIGGWPSSLRTAVGMLLAMPGPATILWGPAHVQLYNDAYIPIAKDRHPALLGRPVAEGWPDAYEEVIVPLLRATDDGRTVRLSDYAVALRAPGGDLEERIFDMAWSPVSDETGAIAGALQTLTEITDVRRARAALRTSEERFRAFVTASADIVYRMNPDWSELHQLDGGGCLSDTVEPGGSWLDRYIHPDDQPAVGIAIAQAIRDRTMFALEHRVRLADGSLGWAHSRAVPILNEAGEITEWLGAASDVTARRRADAALRESEERFRGLVEGFGQFSWEARADGHIVADSPGWRTYTGQNLDQWRGYGWLAAIHPDDRESTERKWRAAVAEGCAVDAEYRLWHAASEAWRWSNVRVVPIRNPDGTIRKWAGVNIDVTDRRVLQTRQEVLVNELQHRSRNLLGVVAAVAARTLGQDAATLAFETRLKALSRAQGLLSQHGSDTVEVGGLVRAELAAHADAASSKVTIAGPPVRLTARQVQNFALALHELTTNAVKYGALRDGSGRLAVTWEVVPGRRDGRRLALTWVESGVSVEPDRVTRRGYGTELIQEALAYALHAKVEYALGRDGVCCRIEMPITQHT